MMLRKYFVLTVVIVLSLKLNSQVVKKSYTTNYNKINLSKTVDKWKVNVQSLEMINPGGNSYSEFLLNQKKRLTDLHPRKRLTSSNKKNLFNDSIIIESSFEGNPYDGKVPNDNTIAISNNGILIEAINASFIIYDTENNELLYSQTLHAMLLEDFWELRFLSKYDPKVIYDPSEDRFILVFLAGKTPSTSNVCVAFTASNDPTGDWNIYVLNGDALDTGHWTDYPAISITEDNLFITGNLLLNGVSWQEGFYQSVIWQIDKYDGYYGNDSLNFSLWSEFKDDSIYVRNIHPVRGARELQSNKQFFLSNKNFSLESDTLYLIKIEDNPFSSATSSSLKRLSLPEHYFLSPNGQQYNGQELATNDSRVLGGIIDENWIQYVHHSMDTSTGTSGIYHGIIYNYEDENPQIQGEIISDTVNDFGYPNIASTGININETECIIGFNYTSVDDTNGVACVYYKDELYSDYKILHKGESAINILSGDIERWGDYSGIQRKYDEPCRVWISGMFGKSTQNGSWISGVAVSDTCKIGEPNPPFTDLEMMDNNKNNLSLYPNPSEEITSIDFALNKSSKIKIEVYSINGTKITTLYDDLVKKGPNRLTFDISELNSGIYIVKFENGKNSLFTKKLIKQ